MQTTPQYFDLLDAFPEQGCPICRLILRDEARYINALIYEYFNDNGTFQAFVAGRGWCNTHGARIRQTKGNVLGLALLSGAAYDEILSLTAGGLFGGVARLLRKNATADALEPVGPCEICTFMDGAEQRYLEAVNNTWNDARFSEAYRQSEGFCLPHVRMLLRRMSDPAPLLAIQREKWTALLYELRDFVQKYDKDNALELIGAEGDSWRRATRYLMGEEGVFGMRRQPKA